MAMRRATLSYPDLESFRADFEGPLRDGFVMLPAEAVTDEPANPLKLDLIVPLVGRVGPVTAQVMSRNADGGLALRLPDLASEAGKGLERVWDLVAQVKAYLVGRGELGGGAELEGLKAEVVRLEEENQALKDALDGMLASAGEDGLVEEETGEGDEEELVEEGGEGDELVEEDDQEELIEEESANQAQHDGGSSGQAGNIGGGEARKPRGFPLLELSRFPVSRSGKLGDGSLDEALVWLTVERAVGILEVEGSDGRKRTGYWDKGGPVGFRVDPLVEAEVLGILLLRAKQVTEEQVRKSLGIMQARGCRQGEAFIEMGVMSFPQLIMVLGKQVEFGLNLILGLKEGRWSFHPLPRLPESFLPPPLKVPNLLYRKAVQAAKDLTSDALAGHFKARINAYMRLDETRKVLLHDVQMNANERKLVEIIGSSDMRTREIFTVSPVSRANTAAMLYAFDALGVLSFSEGNTTEGYLAKVRENIEKKKRALLKSTHFDVVEVHWISLQDEIEAGIQRVRTEYDPKNYRDLPEDMLNELKAIRARVDAAEAILKEPLKRREYRKTLLEPFMIEQSAELLAKKGEMAVMRHDRREAVLCFSKALELEPKNPDYQASLQRAQAI
jgi:hypothetical protein